MDLSLRTGNRKEPKFFRITSKQRTQLDMIYDVLSNLQAAPFGLESSKAIMFARLSYQYNKLLFEDVLIAKELVQKVDRMKAGSRYPSSKFDLWTVSGKGYRFLQHYSNLVDSYKGLSDLLH